MRMQQLTERISGVSKYRMKSTWCEQSSSSRQFIETYSMVVVRHFCGKYIFYENRFFPQNEPQSICNLLRTLKMLLSREKLAKI